MDDTRRGQVWLWAGGVYPSLSCRVVGVASTRPIWTPYWCLGSLRARKPLKMTGGGDNL